jgi:hypothetical protein
MGGRSLPADLREPAYQEVNDFVPTPLRDTVTKAPAATPALPGENFHPRSLRLIPKASASLERGKLTEALTR